MHLVFIILGLFVIVIGLNKIRGDATKMLIEKNSNKIITSDDTLAHENDFKKSVTLFLLGIVLFLIAWYLFNN